LADWFGHRNLLLMAMAPALVGHFGLALSGNVLEIIFFRTLIGFGYAIATLAFQDYVLDLLPKEQRVRSLGFVTAALFGGIFAGTSLGGILADRLRASAVFYVSAGLVVTSAVLTLRFVPSGQRARDAEPAGAARGCGCGNLARPSVHGASPALPSRRTCCCKPSSATSLPFS
jgi:MFS family permease